MTVDSVDHPNRTPLAQFLSCYVGVKGRVCLDSDGLKACERCQRVRRGREGRERAWLSDHKKQEISGCFLSVFVDSFAALLRPSPLRRNSRYSTGYSRALDLERYIFVV